MNFTVTATTPRQAYLSLLELFIHDGAQVFDLHYTSSKTITRVWAHNLTLHVEDPYDETATFNLANSGYTFPSRWNKFLREYTEPEGFKYFINDFATAKIWKDVGYTCPVKADHSSGNCLLGISGHVPGARQKGRITLHSRSTIIAPTGVLDLGMGVAVIRALVDNYKFDPHDFDLVWHIGHAQLINWKTINTITLFQLYPGPDALPDTLVGRSLAQAQRASLQENGLPNIKMFYRQGIKHKRLKETGYIGSGLREFYPYIPSTHLPDHLEPKAIDFGEYIDDDFED